MPFRAGDIILLTRKKNDNWLEGTHKICMCFKNGRRTSAYMYIYVYSASMNLLVMQVSVMDSVYAVSFGVSTLALGLGLDPLC